MTTRAYASPARDAAAAEKRARVVAAATTLLRSQEDVTEVSLEAVAKAAGVTRLTVYNQFGSRRGLLEAVLDQLAKDAGFDRLGEAMATTEPREALGRLIELVCHAWAYDNSMARLHAAAQIDAEFAEVVAKRIERRRGALRVLVNRMTGERMTQENRISERARTDLVDLLFALTSYAVFDELSSPQRTPKGIAEMMKRACVAALDGTLRGKSNR